MYLIDTNTIREVRKAKNANPGVKKFFDTVLAMAQQVYISVITIGELRRGIDLIHYRGDISQANRLEKWLTGLITEYGDYILDFSFEEAQVWGKLRVPHHENAIDKQIAATALIYDLTLVTRNIKDFEKTGVKLLNPFSEN